MRDPADHSQEVICEVCGQKIVWEHPDIPGLYLSSSDYINCNICRSCLTEHCNQTNCLTCRLGTWPNCRHLWLKDLEENRKMCKVFQYYTADQQSISRRFAYVYQRGGQPIRTVSEIPGLVQKGLLSTKKVQWDSPDEKWQAQIDRTWWGRNHPQTDDEHIDPRMYLLRDRLLTFGGAEVCMPVQDEDISDILEHGQLWWGDRVQYMKGRPSRCHENASLLYAANKARNRAGDSYHMNITIATGYALSKDGLWRQHSWCLKRNTRSVTVVETTEKRLLYFGFAMTGEKAEEFEYFNT